MASATMMGPPQGWAQNQPTQTHPADPSHYFSPSDRSSRHCSHGLWNRYRQHPPREGGYQVSTPELPPGLNKQTAPNGNEQAYCPKTGQHWDSPLQHFKEHPNKNVKEFHTEAGQNGRSEAGGNSIAPSNNDKQKAGFPNNAEQFRGLPSGSRFWQDQGKRADEFNPGVSPKSHTTPTDKKDNPYFRQHGSSAFFYHPGMKKAPWEGHPDKAQWQDEAGNSASTPEFPNNQSNQAAYDKKKQACFPNTGPHRGPPQQNFNQHLRKRAEEFSMADGWNNNSVHSNDKQLSGFPNDAGQCNSLPEGFQFGQDPSKRPDEFIPEVGQNNQATISRNKDQMFSGRHHRNAGFWHLGMRGDPWEGRPDMTKQWAEARGNFAPWGGMHGFYGKWHPGFHRGLFNRGASENGAFFREFDFF